MRKIINYIIIVLFFLMIIFRIYDRRIYDIYNNILCYLCILVILISSIYFTFKLRFLQFNIFKMVNVIRKSSKKERAALFMSLGSKIGVGSIVGISLAIYLNGPGVLLWIWIINLFSAILTYCEIYLGNIYKKGNCGGVFYYISRGLDNKGLALIYTLILIFVYAVGFIGIQSNTIVKSINYIGNIDSYVIVLILSIVILLIIFGNINFIINFMAKLVPIMCSMYLILGIFIILSNVGNIKSILELIFRDGLRQDKAILNVMIAGVQRGMFATESGIGTSSIAGNISDGKKENQGLFQVMGVHFISLVIITITGFLVISGSNDYVGNINGIEMIFNIFNNNYGMLGSLTLCIIIILFALSTIVSGYYYSIKGLEFLKGKLLREDYLIVKIFVVFLVGLGGIIDSTIIWSVIDMLVLFLFFINVYSIVRLRKKVLN